MSAPKIRAYSLRRAAFSLVEVALALGIAASALLVIFSLIPIGLATLHDTGRQIVEAEIYTRIGSELATTALYDDPPAREDQRDTQTGPLRKYCEDTSHKRFPAFFDSEGNEISRSAVAPTTIPPQAVFVVQCTYGDGVNTKPTAAVWSPAASGELLTATVSIGFHQDPLFTPVPAANVRRRTFLLSNHGS